MGSISLPENEIPLIDIEPFLDPSSSQQDRDFVVAQVRDACKTYGFFQLIGHGIPQDLQQKILGCAELFFDLPLEKKKAVGMDRAMGKSNRGYEIIGGQQLQADTLPDLKEGIYLGVEIPETDPRAGKFLRGPNLWPDLPEERFRKIVEEYHRRVMDLGHVLLQIFALGLPYSPDVFDEFMTDPVANVRLLHYPPQTSKDARQLGAGAHTDFGCVTLLLQQPNQDGLEVLYPPTNSWIPVPAVADRYVVNVGDLLHRWTGGEYRSALHRVINLGTEHRYSVPFFYNGNMAHKLMPLDGSDDANAVTVEQHILGKFSESYAVKAK